MSADSENVVREVERISDKAVKVAGIEYRVLENADRYAIGLNGDLINTHTGKAIDWCISSKGIKTTLIDTNYIKWKVVALPKLVLEYWKVELGPAAAVINDLVEGMEASRSTEFVKTTKDRIFALKQEGMTTAAMCQLFDMTAGNLYTMLKHMSYPGYRDIEDKSEEQNTGGRVSFTKLSDK